jgi:predicted permease
MGSVWNDLRYALRQLKKSPGFTITVIVTLALGIGANTGMFTVLETLLLRALPIHDAQRVMYITENDSPDNVWESGNGAWTFTMPVFEQLRQDKKIFSDVAGYVPMAFNKVDVRVGKTPDAVHADMVSGNFFSTLGVAMARGRALRMDDEKLHTQNAVISYDYWTRAFARNPDAIGLTLFVRGIPFTVIGVTAPGFNGVEPMTHDAFWIPFQNRPDLKPLGFPASTPVSLYSAQPWSVLNIMGRLALGRTKKSAETALSPMLLRIWYSTLGRTIPPKKNLGVELMPATGVGPISDQVRQPLRMTMGLVLLVLLIACTNVAMLILARNAQRQREIAVRVALGAGCTPLARQLLAESFLLVAAGAGLGWALAAWVAPMLARTISTMQYDVSFHTDARVLAFTLIIATLATLIFGLAPLYGAMRIPPTFVMKVGSAAAGTNRNQLLGRRLALSVQTALCVVLLVAAALMVRTLRKYQTQDLGIRMQGLLTFGLNPARLHSDAGVIQFYRNLLDKLRVMPGVESATVEMMAPGMQNSNNNDLIVDGADKSDYTHGNVFLRSNDVGSDFFHVLGIPILRGRGIISTDMPDSEHVVVVNQTLADRFLPHTDLLGHTIGGKGHAFTIVGVAQNSKFTSVDEPKMPMAWFPYTQQDSVWPEEVVELHTYGDPMAILPTVRRVVAQIDPNLPVEDPRTQQALFANSYLMNSLTAGLTSFFGLMAALLVAIGLYGTLAYRVGRRTQEIGVRMALGATRQGVQWMVLRESLWDGRARHCSRATACSSRGEMDAIAVVQTILARSIGADRRIDCGAGGRVASLVVPVAPSGVGEPDAGVEDGVIPRNTESRLWAFPIASEPAKAGQARTGKKRAPRRRGQSALVLSCVRAFQSTFTGSCLAAPYLCLRRLG